MPLKPSKMFWAKVIMVSPPVAMPITPESTMPLARTKKTFMPASAEISTNK